MKNIHDYNSSLLYPTPFAKLVNDSFAQALCEPNSRFYILRINGSIEGLARFVDEKPGCKYFGSFNLSPAIDSFGIGGRFLEEMLKHEGEDSRIRLLVSDNNPFKGAYEKKYGFQTTETMCDYDLGTHLSEPSGVDVHEMIRYPVGHRS
jgi:hypothetical protein